MSLAHQVLPCRARRTPVRTSVTPSVTFRAPIRTLRQSPELLMSTHYFCQRLKGEDGYNFGCASPRAIVRPCVTPCLSHIHIALGPWAWKPAGCILYVYPQDNELQDHSYQ
jgi:hypothetical protein